jgi:cathepsin D
MDADGNYTSFNLGQESEGSSMCVGALAGVDLGLGKNVWLLGDRYVGYRRMSEGAVADLCFASFMKNVYTVFDTGNSSVGFAELSESQ